MQAIVRHVDWEVIKCLVIAGPGFAKDQFREYLDGEAQRREVRSLILNRGKIVVAPASSAYTHVLKEVLASPAIAGQIKVRGWMIWTGRERVVSVWVGLYVRGQG